MFNVSWPSTYVDFELRIENTVELLHSCGFNYLWIENSILDLQF